MSKSSNRIPPRLPPLCPGSHPPQFQMKMKTDPRREFWKFIHSCDKSLLPLIINERERERVGLNLSLLFHFFRVYSRPRADTKPSLWTPGPAFTWPSYAIESHRGAFPIQRPGFSLFPGTVCPSPRRSLFIAIALPSLIIFGICLANHFRLRFSILFRSGKELLSLNKRIGKNRPPISPPRIWHSLTQTTHRYSNILESHRVLWISKEGEGLRPCLSFIFLP